ncbi:MAG: type III secretion system export apparatus subunit SctR [Deltaproteobacteria bacterium]|nr:type III secretion system export apparatus subunit SctR [Deltaproteobacteria bacterium]
MVLPWDALGAERSTNIKDVLGKDTFGNKPLVLMVAMGALTLIPFALMLMTSFVKISVVLSIVRSAIGTQQIPPTQVITGLAVVLTVYIMAPVGIEVYRVNEDLVKRESNQGVVSGATADLLIKAVERGQEPMRNFLIKHSHLKDRDMFYKLAWRMRKPVDRDNLSDKDWLVLIPSFVVSELSEAFQIGFVLFVPFLVVDIVVSNILMALGMQMLSPTTISLPFKLLLFVMVDGWYLLTKGLVVGYQ